MPIRFTLMSILSPSTLIPWDFFLTQIPATGSRNFYRLKASSGAVEIGLGPEGFALIPAGSFEMGDSFNEGTESELPVHSVFVTSFHMGRTSVTSAHWEGVRAWAMNKGYLDLPIASGVGGISRSKGPDHPLDSVSWHDVVKWCNAVSEREGVSPVYRVNGMVFRTGELDEDNYYAQSPDTDPRGPDSVSGTLLGATRIVRGGAWGNGARSCRVASRGAGSPQNRYSGTGFRLARSTIPEGTHD